MIMIKQIRFFLLLIVGLCVPLSGYTAPKSDLLIQWQESNETNTTAIDHSQWQAVLDKYLKTHDSNINRVDYKALQADGADQLNDYLDSLFDIDPREYNKKEQFAYWVNLYNAATAALIIENYPVESITKIKDSILAFGPWDQQWLEIGDEVLSLNDVEHRILRPIWKDNRIHYAVNCASLSCPNLSPLAFTSQNTEIQLKNLANDYINHPRGVSVINDRLHVSSIYDWYKGDFGNNNQELLEHFLQHADHDLKSQLLNLKNPSYKDDYDWQLNDLSQKLDKF